MKFSLLSLTETAIERPRKRRRNDVPSSPRGDICWRGGGRERGSEESRKRNSTIFRVSKCLWNLIIRVNVQTKSSTYLDGPCLRLPCRDGVRGE